MKDEASYACYKNSFLFLLWMPLNMHKKTLNDWKYKALNRLPEYML